MIDNIEPKDPSKRHFYISLVKSGIRFLACLGLYRGDIQLAALLLAAAEALGVAEEVF
jgi:hypothetical protein